MKTLKQKIVEILEGNKSEITTIKVKTVEEWREELADQILEVVEKDRKTMTEIAIKELNFIKGLKIKVVLDEIREFRFYVSEKLEQTAKNCYELVDKIKSWQEKLK